MKETPIKLLLVDDEKHLLLSLSDRLKSEGFDVTTANSGENALARLDETTPDLIILDISMPGMGGVGFLRRITRADGSTAYPVLVLTARGNMKDFFESVQVDGFLGKPCDESDLIAKIQEIVGHHKQSTKKAARTKKRILLAEDDERHIKPITHTLESAGYEVELIRTGPNVLDKGVSIQPDLFLLKEILAGLNGSSVASMLQVMPSVCKTPVILFDHSRTDEAPKPKGVDSLQNIKSFLCTADPARLCSAANRVLNANDSAPRKGWEL